MSCRTLTLVAFYGLAFLTSFLSEGTPTKIPLKREKVSLPKGHYLRTRNAIQSGSVFETQNFWFGQFDIGDSKNVSILIDTGSPDLILNPGNVYKPGPQSKNLHSNFSTSYTTTNSDGSGHRTIAGPVYEDSVALAGTNLEISQQELGVALKWEPRVTLPFPGDGLIGLSGQESILGDNVTSWWTKLCNSTLIEECRFGLAFGTDDSGIQYFGGVEESAFEGDLTTAPVFPGWALYGDLAVNGTVIRDDIPIQTDSGTATILAPIDHAQEMFDASGMEVVQTLNSDNNTVLYGYYDCAKPPHLGFQFPSCSNRTEAQDQNSGIISQEGKIFDVAPHGLELNSTGTRCQSTIVGVKGMTVWLVGQAFMQGKYIDHNKDAGTMGFAEWK